MTQTERLQQAIALSRTTVLAMLDEQLKVMRKHPDFDNEDYYISVTMGDSAALGSYGKAEANIWPQDEILKCQYCDDSGNYEFQELPVEVLFEILLRLQEFATNQSTA